MHEPRVGGQRVYDLVNKVAVYAVFPDVSRRLKSSWPAFAGHAGNSTWRCDPMDWKAESAVLRKKSVRRTVVLRKKSVRPRLPSSGCDTQKFRAR